MTPRTLYVPDFTSMKLDRVALLCDELLRRGVPISAVEPVVDWLNKQDGRVHIDLSKLKQ